MDQNNTTQDSISCRNPTPESVENDQSIFPTHTVEVNESHNNLNPKFTMRSLFDFLFIENYVPSQTEKNVRRGFYLCIIIILLPLLGYTIHVLRKCNFQEINERVIHTRSYFPRPYKGYLQMIICSLSLIIFSLIIGLFVPTNATPLVFLSVFGFFNFIFTVVISRDIMLYHREKEFQIWKIYSFIVYAIPFVLIFGSLAIIILATIIIHIVSFIYLLFHLNY